jgi:hypothetical protein
MMDYSKLSDFEINKAVSEKLGLHWHCKPLSHMNKTMSWLYSDNYAQCDTARFVAIDLPDYCNSWADMGAIILNYGICLMSPIHKSTNDKWEASWNESGGRWNGGGDIRFRHKNPLRAAAIVYLMMGDNVKTEAQASAKGIDL